ncbi:hypothetical protein [Amaricoccus sp.]|uniref:hypothetical protein n=1 Tax=Amaricoccus sp. TaxID=1872485 RepID=UPI002614CE34|nr:hypothetical protein [Amaricoccus sp.]HRO13177.1 hypothetical protein [Amaricoccus sp.]
MGLDPLLVHQPPSRQATFFELPWTLMAKSQALLDRWDTLKQGERTEAIRAGAAAVALLILTRVAPIRIGNPAAISFRGKSRWLSEPAKGQLALLVIPARHVKNRKEIRAHLQDAGRRDSWGVIKWYLETIRPRMIEGLRGAPSKASEDALFPGEKGSVGGDALRSWIMVETALAGFPIRPHQVRYAIASILINRHPDKITLIAAILGDTVATVERVYAWLELPSTEAVEFSV